MDNQQHLEIPPPETELAQVSDLIWSLAKQCQDDPKQLLGLLRTLELLHGQIREELFQPSLPNTRHALYTLLKDIEEHGGWPYIPRLKIQQLCVNMLLLPPEEVTEPVSVTEI